MFYLASDNALAPGVITHLKAMKDAGYHPQVNVLAQFDPHGDNVPVHIFDVNRLEKLEQKNTVNIGFEPDNSYVRNLVVDKLWDEKGRARITKAMLKKNLSYSAPVPLPEMTAEQEPKDSLREFLTFCSTEYPARHYMLFLLGHGQVVGGDVFLYDEHGRRTEKGVSGPGSLVLKDLGKILKDFKAEIRNEKTGHDGELELIGFHSCSMSSVEVAFELKDTANYMLAAQGPTYVGSWPYRQILMRLYNDLGSSPFSRDDLKNNKMIDDLKEQQTGKTFEFMQEQFANNGVGQLLANHVTGQTPRADLVTAMAHKFSDVISNPNLCDKLPYAGQSTAIEKLIDEHRKHHISGEYLKWLNRQLLLDGLTAEARTAYTKVNIKRLLISIFNYCIFNIYDFQICGYSGDLTLCDLRQVDKLSEPVDQLVTALKYSMLKASNEKDPMINDLLVLAHWQAQSFFEEKYTDLYDFCFCLKRRCEKVRSSDQLARCVQEIIVACNKVMNVLKRGSDANDDGLIVRCEPAGPAHQYAHGFSVYFPWSEPVNNDTWDNQYATFEFNQTGWRSFLEHYFDLTLRELPERENDELDPCPLPPDLDEDMMDLLEDMSTGKFYDDDGAQLKSGSRDPLGGGKSGSLDPTGSDCDCGSIKNYPMISHSRLDEKRFRAYRTVCNLYKSFGRLCSSGD